MANDNHNLDYYDHANSIPDGNDCGNLGRSSSRHCGACTDRPKEKMKQMKRGTDSSAPLSFFQTTGTIPAQEISSYRSVLWH